ncbi:MAG: hypothetical protein ACLFWB_09400 [Armatimonadota bacterium]
MAQCPACNGKLPHHVQTCPYCGADTTWWLSREGEVYGPYDERTVRYILQDNRATEEDLAMIGRQGQWRPLRKLLEQTPDDLTTKAPRATRERSGAAQERYRHWSVRQWGIFAAVMVVVCAAAACALVGPTYRAIATREADARSRANLEQIWLALKLHASYHKGRLPHQGEWIKTLEGFAGDETLRSQGGQRYWLNEKLGGRGLADLPDPSTLIVAAEPGAMSEKPTDRNLLYLYADGHIDAAKPGEDTGRTEP